MLKDKLPGLLMIPLLCFLVFLFTGCPPEDPDEPSDTAITIDFSALAPGTYNVGDTFTQNGVDMKVLPFHDGFSLITTGTLTIPSLLASGGSGQDMQFTNTCLGFDYHSGREVAEDRPEAYDRGHFYFF